MFKRFIAITMIAVMMVMAVGAVGFAQETTRFLAQTNGIAFETEIGEVASGTQLFFIGTTGVGFGYRRALEQFYFVGHVGFLDGFFVSGYVAKELLDQLELRLGGQLNLRGVDFKLVGGVAYQF